ncbi:hypothetical protein NXS15_01250 [Mycoplasma sp. CSL7475-4]|uniref:hypothetical protein n=1 Tax=Mycoplasma sp. CSL7475-4 TaxID=2973942 RepID=UPI00216AF1C0|nr:hypothetical protein [Mycoplasma sp. CSL7475-4]MCS4536757.1 hypothetical protein [Mycoplasma sp. CSL7475-4]
MHIWIERLSNRWKAVLIALSILTLITSICLLISALADDGNNLFAKVFFIVENIEVKDDRWKEFLQYAQEHNIGTEHIEKLREIFGDRYTIENARLNVIGFTFFNISMILLIVISLNILSASMFVTIKLAENSIDRLRRENLIDQEAYSQISQILAAQNQQNIKQKNSKFNPQLLSEKIKELEQGEQDEA